MANKSREEYDAMFERLCETVKIDKTYDIDNFAVKNYDLKYIPPNGPRKDRLAYTHDRKQITSIMNARAVKYDKPWKIRQIERSKTIMIVKRENARLGTVRGVKQTVQNLNNQIKQNLIIIDNPNSPIEQKQLCQIALNTFLGAKMSLRGSIMGSKKIEKEIKKEILMLPEWDKFAV